MLVVNPELKNVDGMKSDSNSRRSRIDKDTPSPCLVLKSRPAVDTTLEGPVNIFVIDEQIHRST